MNLRTVVRILALLAVLASLSSAGSAAWLSGKSLLAQHLLNAAWQTSKREHSPVKPWRWADVSTVGLLSVPASNETLIVLSDASGEAMAFGPGLVAGNPAYASSSAIAIGGHRDTHLAFLEHQRPGDRILLETTDGQQHHYEMMDSQIVDSRAHTLSIATDSPGLVLITCYPFNASQTGGPLRLVVRAAYLHS